MPLTFKNLSFSLMYLVLITGLMSACAQRSHHDDNDDTRMKAFSGGLSGTVFDTSSNAFEGPLPDLTDEEFARHAAGDAIFGAKFVTSPAPIYPGLGPIYNNTSCDGCHIKEGRGTPKVGTGPSGSQMLVMLSMPPGTTDTRDSPGGLVRVPGVGLQIRDQAVFGQQPNGNASIKWVDGDEQSFGDGTTYKLRRPVATVTLKDGGKLPDDVQMSLRQPLHVYGLGLLEAIPEVDIRARAEDPDKVPGHVSEVWSQSEGKMVLGRFGRKAGIGSILDQAAKALALDIGIVNELFKNGETPEGTDNEIKRQDIEDAAYYLRTIGVPARRNLDNDQVQHGEMLFRKAGCIGCHAEEWTTGEHEIASLSNQTIRPYSDLLLHDMGEDLADGRPEYDANGREWRTPALWGIGLAETILPNATYLHDGRARSVTEAILWHGGQALGPREFFRNASEEDRNSLLAFLKSL